MSAENKDRYILIVDDDREVRDAFMEILSEAGFRVCAADNGSAALAMLAGSQPLPSLIFLDLMMPDMDGWTFRRLQKGYHRLSHIPTAIMTAVPKQSWPAEDHELVAILAKPI